MIYALVGHSASGKSTIERNLETYGIERIISTTTRPPRDGEVDEVDYYFVSEEHFAHMLDMGLFAEHAQYRDWHYGLSLLGVDYIRKDYVAVVTPKGYRDLLKSVGKECIKSIFINVPERERLIRMAMRGDDIDEIIRRIYADRIDFEDFEDEADLILDNEDVAFTASLIRAWIKRDKELEDICNRMGEILLDY